MHQWLQPLLAVGLCAVTCRAEVLPRSPSLLLRSPSLLVNASRSITVSWEPVAEAHLGYELRLSVTRPGASKGARRGLLIMGAHPLYASACVGYVGLVAHSLETLALALDKFASYGYFGFRNLVRLYRYQLAGDAPLTAAALERAMKGILPGLK